MVAHINRNYILLGFIFSIASGALWPSMPALILLMPIVVLFLALFFIKYDYLKKTGYLGQGLLLGGMIVIIHGNHYRDVTETLFSQGSHITVQAKVISLVHPAIHGKQMVLSLHRIGRLNLTKYAQPNVKVFFNLKGDNQPQLGEYWQFKLHVKPIIGQLNDAGFDNEQYYVSNLWHGKAVIEPDDGINIRIKTGYSFRLWLHTKVSSYLNELASKPFIIALAFGDRSLISAQQWQQLRDSGLSHLMAISGLHIGLAMAIGWNVGRLIKSSLLFIMPSFYFVRFLPLFSGFFIALMYAYLAGFSLPTQRAVIMGGLVLFMLSSRIHWSVWQILLLSLSLVLLIQPFSILQMGFWLSFGAIVIIYLSIWFYRQQKINRGINWRQVIIVQLGLFIGLGFLNVIFFGGASWVSPVINLLAIPWVSVVVVPAVFCGLILSALFDASWLSLVWQWVDVTLFPILWLLHKVEGAWLPLSHDWGVASLWLCFIVLAWRFRFYSAFYVVTILAVLWAFFPARPKPSWQVQILDVGQGLAVLIRKEQQTVLYDTGISWEGGSIADSVIVPLLRQSGEYQLSGLVISHTDSDHAGGRLDVEARLSPTWRRSSEFLDGYLPCIQGQSWHWKGLNFDVVWPPKQVERAYNPHSCVIKISDQQFTLLLTGDIDAISELLMMRGNHLSNVDVMTVPHHGSETSSFPLFVDAVRPKVAIASVALNNQWGLPSEKIKSRYLKNGAQWLDTAHSGQITISIYSNDWFIEQKRVNQYQPWYRQIVRKGLE